MKQVFISFVGDRDEDNDDFRIVGDTYEDVLKHLCLFLNDQHNFNYQFSMKPIINGEEIKDWEEINEYKRPNFF